jgi:small multidrug resistance pump
MNPGWILLLISVLTDVVASLLSKQLDGLKHPVLLATVALCYLTAVVAFSCSVRLLPMGPAFAIWSGASMAAVALLAIPLYGQAIDLAGGIGMGLILTGSIVLALYSKMQVE